LAFEASLSVPQHAMDAIKALHLLLSFLSPADYNGDYRP
jgi:hypothetical protein